MGTVPFFSALQTRSGSALYPHFLDLARFHLTVSIANSKVPYFLFIF